ncbi:M16 family metallopeptidase [Streptomyces sp. NPDC001401]|uniref:M16 family metallopeptidase n=1 Tax=Streptomyces sp. NPDC001401 TaxID=3364570 RepID=UPI0036CA3AC5
MLPALAALPEVVVPPIVRAATASGMTIMASRYALAPMAMVRLSLSCAPDDAVSHARSEVLAAALDKTLSDALAATGASVTVHRQGQWLGISVHAPSQSLEQVLEHLSRVVASPCADAAVTAWAVRQVTSRTVLAAGQPHLDSAVAFLRHLYQPVPAAMQPVADTTLVAGATAEVLARHQSRMISARGGHLVVVSDHDPEVTAAWCERYFADVADTGERRARCPAPDTGRTVVLDRPGRHQSHIRLAAPAIPRQDPAHLALSLANAVFGGYFSSRLVLGLREREGLAYRVQAVLGEHLDRHVILVEADTAPDRTSHTVGRIDWYLRQLTSSPITEQEVDQARRYMTGTMLISMSSQAGLAATFDASLVAGEDPENIPLVLERLAGVPACQVRQAAAEFYAPDRFGGVIVADTGADTEETR